MNKHDYYNEFFELGQQKINFSLYEVGLPSDDSVYTLKKVMEEKHKKAFGAYPEETTADSGYCSEKNLGFMENSGIKPYIKLQEQFLLYAIGRNINKYHRFLLGKINASKTLILAGIFLFRAGKVKNRYFPTAPSLRCACYIASPSDLLLWR